MELVRSLIINGDVGDIDNFEYIVLGMSKCGTTSIQDSLNGCGLRTIKFHSDHTLTRVYKTKGITSRSLVKHAPRVFVPYRNPIDRKVSQYYFYAKHKNKSPLQQITEIRNLCLGDYSLFNKGEQTEINEDIFFENLSFYTGIDILDYEFDKEAGFTLIEEPKISMIVFNIESSENLASFLREVASANFKLMRSRVSNKTPERQWVRKSLGFSDDDLDTIFSSVYCRYFYSDQQIEEFKLWEKG